jgi:hypothetical protein
MHLLLGHERPGVFLIPEQVHHHERDMDAPIVVLAGGLDEENAALAAGTERVGKDAARGARADNNKVEWLLDCAVLLGGRHSILLLLSRGLMPLGLQASPTGRADKITIDPAEYPYSIAGWPEENNSNGHAGCEISMPCPMEPAASPAACRAAAQHKVIPACASASFIK